MPSQGFLIRLPRTSAMTALTGGRAIRDGLLDDDRRSSEQGLGHLAERSSTPWASPTASPARGKPLASLIGLGCLALAFGVLVYLTDRDPSHASLIPAVAALAGGHMFGGLGQWLPSFVHPFAFSLFTAAARPPSRSPSYSSCWLWWAVNVAFEVAQHPNVNMAVAEGAQVLLGQTWLARLLSSYFLRGTFDVGDIVAATAGALAAAGVLYLIDRLESRNAQ